MDMPITDQCLMLAVAKAVEEVCATQCKPGRGGLRDRVDDALLIAYAQNGCKSYDIKLDGEKLGAITVKQGEPEPVIEDMGALDDWMIDNGFRCESILDVDKIPEEEIRKLKYTHPEWFTKNIIDRLQVTKNAAIGENGCALWPETGEVIPGVRFHQKPISTALTGCKPDKVIDVIRRHGLATTAVAALIEGGV